MSKQPGSASDAARTYRRGRDTTSPRRHSVVETTRTRGPERRPEWLERGPRLVFALHCSAVVMGPGAPSRSILVIDDDADMRHVFRDFLGGSGYRVIEASNGKDGIQQVESQHVDAVIIDKEMPGMNGLDVLSVLHERHPRLPVIFITAFGGRDVAAESVRRGACFYFEKPFRLGTVVEAVQSLLENAGS